MSTDKIITEPLVKVDYKKDLSAEQRAQFLSAESTLKSPFYGQGPANPITDKDGTVLDKEAYDKDTVTGFTNPNLHRRIDPQEPDEDRRAQGEQAPREYAVGIYGLNSYRTERKLVHIEGEDAQDEIP